MVNTSPWRKSPNKSWGEEHKRIFNDKKGFIISARYGSKHTIASVIQPLGMTDEELQRNAQLIEAAPLLLDACIEALKHHQGGHSEIGEQLKQVIELATK